jgi:hypothetical protein
MIEFLIPIKTVNEANGSHGHWRVKARRRKAQRHSANEACWWALNNYKPRQVSLPCVVTMSRLSAGTLDDDNLRVSLKSVRDGIADAFGVADNDPRIEWRYAQEKCKCGEYGVMVRIEPSKTNEV